MPPRAPLLALVLVSACARTLPAAGPAARALLAPDSAEVVFGAAVVTLESHGYRLFACDPALGAATTARQELDAPCGASSCLARQTVRVKLGHRVAKVVVDRQFWDHAGKQWVDIRDPDVERVERELLVEVMERAAELRPPLRRAANPCSKPLVASRP